MPILHLAQLLGAAAGIREDELKFKRHVVRLSREVQDKLLRPARGPGCRRLTCGSPGDRARRSARRPARPARRRGRAALRPRRDRGRSQPLRLEAGADARCRGWRRCSRPGSSASRADAGAPVVGIAGNRDFAWWWDRRHLREAAVDVPLRRRGDASRRARVRLALVPAAPRAAEGRRAAAALAAAAAGRRRCRTGLRAAAAASSWRAGRTSSPSTSPRSPRASTSWSRTRRRSGTATCTAVGDRVGSTALLEAIERAQPPLAVFGHIHEGRGEPTRAGRTLCANSAICDRWFERRNQPWLIDVDLAARSAELDCDQLVNTH